MFNKNVISWEVSNRILYNLLVVSNFLGVTMYSRSTFGTRAFSVAGPTVWNSLPDSLRNPSVESELFRWDLKKHLFAGH